MTTTTPSPQTVATAVGRPHTFRTIESHTAGNPTRTVVSGVPELHGDTMLEKMHDLEAGGHLPMCGHDTIGLVTVLLQHGLVPAVEPTTQVVLDTPAGLVETTARPSTTIGSPASPSRPRHPSSTPRTFRSRFQASGPSASTSPGAATSTRSSTQRPSAWI